MHFRSFVLWPEHRLEPIERPVPHGKITRLWCVRAPSLCFRRTLCRARPPATLPLRAPPFRTQPLVQTRHHRSHRNSFTVCLPGTSSDQVPGHFPPGSHCPFADDGPSVVHGAGEASAGRIPPRPVWPGRRRPSPMRGAGRSGPCAAGPRGFGGARHRRPPRRPGIHPPRPRHARDRRSVGHAEGSEGRSETASGLRSGGASCVGAPHEPVRVTCLGPPALGRFVPVPRWGCGCRRSWTSGCRLVEAPGPNCQPPTGHGGDRRAACRLRCFDFVCADQPRESLRWHGVPPNEAAILGCVDHGRRKLR